jgi:hypothetical protein
MSRRYGARLGFCARDSMSGRSHWAESPCGELGGGATVPFDFGGTVLADLLARIDFVEQLVGQLHHPVLNAQFKMN